jgi:hypothetical protein
MTMNPSRRRFFQSTAAAGGIAVLGPKAVLAQQAAGTFTPEMFGAKGDGVANDSRAFAMLGHAVTEAGGGTVTLRKTTYIVGGQTRAISPTSLYYFSPVELMVFKGCTRPVTVRGNGARLKCADGLRYGVFDLEGRRVDKPMPYLGPGVASPYNAMIRAQGCSGAVEISDLELDGNLPGLIIGGAYGDTGRQIPTNGIALFDNSGPELVRNVHSHHHPMDGLSIDGVDAAGPGLPKRLIQGLRSEYNGRQGVSITGGRGYVFERCKFNHTGRSVIESAPAAGVDIEAENGKKNRDHSFTDCEFIDNVGCGLVADSGDSDGGTFTRCTFVGTTAWSIWPFKPNFRFNDCRIVGAVVNAYGDKDLARATQFNDCVFLDDPALAPGGKIYYGDRVSGPVVELSQGLNVQFRRCTFRLTHQGLLPWTWYAIYEDCRMSQHAPGQAFPKGKYLGHNALTGNVDLYGTWVGGVLVANGTRLEKVQMGGKTW